MEVYYDSEKTTAGTTTTSTEDFGFFQWKSVRLRSVSGWWMAVR